MSSAGRIRVMVVDDHPIVRDGIGDALEASGRFDVVGCLAMARRRWSLARDWLLRWSSWM